MKLLNPFEIALSGINLVEASAGTGKTYNITSLYIRALIERDISVGKILVVTYTEAATKELKDRLLHRIRASLRTLKSGEVDDSTDQFLTELLSEVTDYEKAAAKLEQAVRMFDEASIYTIHGFCYQALQEQAFESRAMYDAEMVGDDSELVQEAVDDYWRNWVAEVSEHPQKKPLLKLLIDNGFGPKSLAKELGRYTGKPHLKVLPEDIPGNEEVSLQLAELEELFSEMKNCWDGEEQTILSLLKAEQLNGNRYGKRYLDDWLQQIDDFLRSDIPSIKLIDKFDKFTASYLKESLTKAGIDKGLEAPEHPFFTLADEYKQVAEFLADYEIIFKRDLLTYLRKELNQKKEEQQVLAYDDLLLRLRNALLDPDRGEKLADKLREKYPLAMVDEFQDTDPNQYDIFRRIYKGADHTALFMIGDPKQSIYSFRGADVYSYIKARKDAPESNRYRLDRNFRSTPDLLRGFNILWGEQEKPFVVDDIAYQEVTWGRSGEQYDTLREYGQERPPIRFRRLSEFGNRLNKGEAKEKVAKDTVKEIRRLLRGGKKGEITIGNKPVRAKDIAVLVRTHVQAELISNALQEEGIKSVRHSEKSVFQTDESEQLEQLLKALVEPGNETLIKTALSLPLTGYTAQDLLAIEEDEERWIQLLGQFTDWHKQWQEQGFAAMFHSLMAELNVAEHVIRYPDGERRLTNILHLGELLQAESQYHREGTRGLLHWLARKRKENSSNTRDEEQMRLESDEDLLKIVTMHKSKGLQYPIVFCPFLWFGPKISDQGQPLEYHHPEDSETTYLDLNGKSDPDRAEKRFYARREELAENMRLAYVAMTRAEVGLYLTWTFSKVSELSSLGYLLQDPEQAEAILKSKVGYGDKVDQSGDVFDDTIEKLCRENPDLFTLQKESKPSEGTQLELLSPDDDSRTSLRARSFKRSGALMPSYRVSSFSSLSSWMDDDPDMPDYDQFLYEEEPETTDEEAKTMFTFPKGPQPGTCIHKIFEDIDFRDIPASKDLIQQNLSTYNIDAQWMPVVTEMLQASVNKSLLQNEGLKLANIHPKHMVQELEFYYSTDHIQAQQLLEIIREETDRNHVTGGETAPGFLKGYIDLTFKFGDKYYLLDYKTNYLGDQISNYDQPALQHEMQEASYDLQYHIYTIALHRFLAQKVPDYSYEKHFGGAFYLFLRGINQDGNEGIFYDRPPYSVIQKLNRYISEEVSDE